MVAGLDAGDAGADGLDDPRALVPAHEREADVAAALTADVLVGVAQACGLVADQHLVLLGRVEIEFGDLPVGAGLVQHRRSRRHARHQRSLLTSALVHATCGTTSAPISRRWSRSSMSKMCR